MKKDGIKKTNPFLAFLLVVVVPVIVTTILVIIILSVAGVNVIDWTKDKASNIPGISKLVTTEEQKQDKVALERANSRIEEQNGKITELEAEISSLEDTIEQLNDELLRNENERESMENINETSTNTEQEDEATDYIKEMSASFKKMKKKQAALIFAELEEEIALAIMYELPNDVRGGIIESMEPNKAADLTAKFINRE
ncbi:MotE family protein [Ornithinibacillus sp. 4-3]|uniref:MotE family protein n=1 Tax=Ornithinibacillus sp. 4-3 TaxID=3231488 RepID=A0AB39HUD6_9BACI